MKIILVGSGRVVYFLSRRFASKGHSLVVVNDDAEECRWLARQIKATVVRGDGSDPRILDDAGAGDADAVLAMTTNDEDNLVICQTAQSRYAVPTTLAVVNDPDNETVFPKLGVKHVVSLTRILSELVLEQTEVDEIFHDLPLLEGKANIVELVLGDDCPALGRPLAQIGLPRDSLIACVLRGEEAIVPRGTTSLEAGDRVVLVTLPKSHGPAVKMLTGER